LDEALRALHEVQMAQEGKAAEGAAAQEVR